jgi:hypothetical protein
MSDHLNETFSTRELLAIVRSVGVDLDGTVLRDWHRRGILPGEGGGHGVERTYTFGALLEIFTLAWVVERIRFLGEARGLAATVANAIARVYRTGPDGQVVDAEPLQFLVTDRGGNNFVLVDEEDCGKLRRLAKWYGARAPVLVAPGYLAMDLWGAIEQVIEAREQHA